MAVVEEVLAVACTEEEEVTVRREEVGTEVASEVAEVVATLHTRLLAKSHHHDRCGWSSQSR